MQNQEKAATLSVFEAFPLKYLWLYTKLPYICALYHYCELNELPKFLTMNLKLVANENI